MRHHHFFWLSLVSIILVFVVLVCIRSKTPSSRAVGNRPRAYTDMEVHEIMGSDERIDTAEIDNL
jgi:hypothetical protein